MYVLFALPSCCLAELAVGGGRPEGEIFGGKTTFTLHLYPASKQAMNILPEGWEKEVVSWC